MPRKQFGMMDDELIARLDALAAEAGQTRRMFTERTLETALGDQRTGSGRRVEPEPVRPNETLQRVALGKGYTPPIPKTGKR